MRALITGSRDWTNYGLLDKVLSGYLLRQGITVVVVHGNAPGADTLAARWAAANHLRVEAHPADWNVAPRSAGIIRNAHMVDLGADWCFGFVKPCTKKECAGSPIHRSHGTAHCLRLAERAGIMTVVTTEGFE